MEKLILTRLQTAIQEKVFPGCVAGIVNAAGDRKIITAGNFTYEAGSPEVQPDTMYDAASITKSIPGSVSLLKLLDEKKINLEDRLVDFVPEFGNFEDKKGVKIKHILTYTLDLDVPATSSLKDKSPEEIIEIITKAPLKSAPGKRYHYNNATAFFVALIIKKVTGKALDEYADENFFKPLKMQRTTFYPNKFSKEEIAPTEIDEWRGRTVHGEVHDESTAILQQKFIPAISGLFTTVPDLLSFQEMLLKQGIKDEITYFSKEIVQQMHILIFPEHKSAGLGWVMNWPEAMGMKCSDQAFCKSGFTGTFICTDPVKNIGFVMLSNRIYPKRPKNLTEINKVRRDISDIVFSTQH